MTDLARILFVICQVSQEGSQLVADRPSTQGLTCAGCRASYPRSSPGIGVFPGLLS